MFSALKDLLHRALSLVIPFLEQARDVKSWNPVLKWTIRILLLIVLYVGLIIVSQLLELGPRIRLPFLPLGAKTYDFWLPTLVMLTLALLWLAYWVWLLLQAQQDEAEFPDILAAWDQGIEALNQAGIDLTEVPLFLIVGSPAGGFDSFFASSQLPLTVKRAPQRVEAPLYFYAYREAVFVTCHGASLVGRESEDLRDEGAPHAVVGSDLGVGVAVEPIPDMSATMAGATMRPNQGVMGEIQAILSRAAADGRGPNQLTPEEQQSIRRLSGSGSTTVEAAVPKRRAPLTKTEVAQTSSRLRYLCRLAVRDRQPFCSLNGIVLLVGPAAAEGEEVANQMGQYCQQDLAHIREVMQIDCPVYVLLADLETVPGFRSFILGFPGDNRTRRLGQRFHLPSSLAATENLPTIADTAVQWVCGSLLPTYIFRFFKEEGRPDDYGKMFKNNAQLFQFMATMRQRGKLLGRIVSRALDQPTDGPLLFGGCYLSATGKDKDTQAFVAGFLQRVMQEQDKVAWTDEAFQEESDFSRWTRIGYLGLGSAICVVVGLGFYFMR